MDDQTSTNRLFLQAVAPVPFPEPRQGIPCQGIPCLPVPLTSFVGRERDVAAAVERIRRPDTRLITLSGPGGVGKTRMAIRLANEVASSFPDGVRFVSLAAVPDPDLVAATIADTLDIPRTGNRSDQTRLEAFLRDRRMLLVLDNFEHLAAAAPLLPALLAACPGLSVLVTSRTVLHLSGEHVVTIPPLSLPAGGGASDSPGPLESEAVRLFIERAEAARSDFSFGTADLPVIAAICAHLDGLPLAIELAAAQVRTLPPRALLARMDQRLALLEGGPCDQPPRLRSMRATVAWSHALLSEQEQILLRRLAVFPGSFTLAAAEAVCGSADLADAVLDGIGSLVDQSLLRRDSDALGEPRFDMLATIRMFGLEQLARHGEGEAARNAHAAWCLGVAERADAHRCTPLQVEAIRWLASEHDNFRAALIWLREAGQAESCVRLVGQLGQFWHRQGHWSEARTWLDRAVGWSAGWQTHDRVEVLNSLAFLALNQGDPLAGLRYNQEALSIARELDDVAAILHSQIGLGIAKTALGDHEEAIKTFTDALATLDEFGDSLPSPANYRVVLLNNLSVSALSKGDYSQAAQWAEDALAAQRASGSLDGFADSLWLLGLMAQRRGDSDRAARYYRESLEFPLELREPQNVAAALDQIALVFSEAGHHAAAVRLVGAAIRYYDNIGLVTPFEQDVVDRERVLSGARVHLGEAAVAVALAEGRVLPLERAFAEARRMFDAPPSTHSHSRSVNDHAHNGLTRREREVLTLLVEGHSDREIASALSIGRRTVETHVSSLLNKMGLESRTAVATYAVRHGLA